MGLYRLGGLALSAKLHGPIPALAAITLEPAATVDIASHTHRIDQSGAATSDQSIGIDIDGGTGNDYLQHLQ